MPNSMTIPNLVGIQMYYIPPEIVDPEASPIYQDWDSDNIIDTVGNRNQYDASTNPDNVLIYRWNMEYQEGYEQDTKNYFWVKNESSYNATVSFTGKYRIQGDREWIDINSLSVSPGETIQIIANRATTGTLYCDQDFSVGGNVLSLLYGEDFENESAYPDPHLPDSSVYRKGACEGLFKSQQHLIDASALILPDFTERACYQEMFYGCSSLVYAPELPATALSEFCYNRMFLQCRSLITAPELPALTLVRQCYYQMFTGCWSLNYIKAMFTEIPSTGNTIDYWVGSVAASGTFVKNSAATWNVSGDSGIPSGWTVQTASS